LLELVREIFGLHQPGQPSGSKLGDHRQGGGSGTAHPYWRMRLLNGLRIELLFGEGDVLALKTGPLLGPDLLHRMDVFCGPSVATLARHPENFEVAVIPVLGCTYANPENEPSFAQYVNICNLPCGHDRISIRKAKDSDAEFDVGSRSDAG